MITSPLGHCDQPQGIDENPTQLGADDYGDRTLTTVRDNGPKWLAATRPYRRQWAKAPLLCALCGKPIKYDAQRHYRDSLTVDHITPLMLDGPMFDPTNWQPAHRGCNSSKGNLDRQARDAAVKVVSSWRW